jgi:hypothetical protein
MCAPTKYTDSTTHASDHSLIVLKICTLHGEFYNLPTCESRGGVVVWRPQSRYRHMCRLNRSPAASWEGIFFFVLCYLLSSPLGGREKGNSRGDGTIKILPRISLPRINLSVCLCVCLLRSVKWPVGLFSTGNRATSFFISLGHTGRCYGVLLRSDT